MSEFSSALNHLKFGGQAKRSGHNWNGMYVAIHSKDGSMAERFLYLQTIRGDKVPWVPSQSDLLADDWCLL